MHLKPSFSQLRKLTCWFLWVYVDASYPQLTFLLDIHKDAAGAPTC